MSDPGRPPPTYHQDTPRICIDYLHNVFIRRAAYRPPAVCMCAGGGVRGRRAPGRPEPCTGGHYQPLGSSPSLPALLSGAAQITSANSLVTVMLKSTLNVNTM